MAVTANTFQAFQAIGNREDLADIIYRVQYTDTPFLSACSKTKATGVFHEWQTQALTAASGANQKVEGDEFTLTAVVPTARIGNYCQISTKVARVSGTQQAVKSAGRADEMAYQLVMRGIELKTDMESSLIGVNTARAAGTTSTARILGSVEAYIKTNTNKGGGSGADPTTADGVNTRTDGTQRAGTEALYKDAIQKIWASGGKPDVIYVGAFNKQVFSSFTGRATQTEDTGAKKITNAVSVYESDFGTMKIVPNNFSRSRSSYIMQSDMWQVASLRDMVTVELGTTGDANGKAIIVEYTLEADNEKSSGGVFDLLTS